MAYPADTCTMTNMNTTKETNMNTTKILTTKTQAITIGFSHTSDSWAYVVVREAGFGAGATSATMIPGAKEIGFFVSNDIDAGDFIGTVEEALQVYLEGRFTRPTDAAPWARNAMAVLASI